MSGIGVVLNPFSKSYKKNPQKLDQMAFIIGDKASCKPTSDLADLARAAEEFKSRDIDILAISGGDGTIHCTLTTFLRIYGEKPLPKISLLKGGTLNTIAGSLGVKGSTQNLMSDLLVKYHEDIPFETRKLRLMKINDDYGCIFGLGVIYNFMEAYYAHPKVNAWVAAKTLFMAIGSAAMRGPLSRKMFERFDAEVTVDGKRWEPANYAALFAGSIRQLGLNFNVFYHMLTQNDTFHVYGISTDAGGILPYVWRMRSGQPTGSSSIIDSQATSMEIILQKPLRYTIDGDMLAAKDKFIIVAGPELTVVF
jgi:diacylglycerol kinase family enzyme